MADTIREFSSGGVVIKKEKNDFLVLLIKDGFGHWTWPKGNIEKGETPEIAAAREIAEETGLTKTRLIEKAGSNEYRYRRSGKLVFKTVYIYLFEDIGTQSPKPQLTEIDEAKWFSPDQALEAIEYKGSKEILKKAIDRFKELN